MIGVGAGEQDGEADGGEHEEDGRPCGELGEEIGRSAGSKGGLRSLAAEGSGEIGGLALLEQNDADRKSTRLNSSHVTESDTGWRRPDFLL